MVYFAEDCDMDGDEHEDLRCEVDLKKSPSNAWR